MQRVYGDVLAENTTMLQICDELGFHAEDIGSNMKRFVPELDNIDGQRRRFTFAGRISRTTRI